MIRLIALAALLSLACRLVFGRWPWEYVSARSTAEQRIWAARRLLGVPPSASSEDIAAAYRRKAALMHPDRGGTTQSLQELNAARDLLLGESPRD